LALVYIPSGRSGADVPGERRLDKGNAILSTLPLSGLLAIENPFETERKVSVAAEVPGPGSTPFRLVNAHLEVTSTFWRVLLTGNQTRARQTAGLIEALRLHEELQGQRPPTLLGGDFNTWSGGETALKMLHSAFSDSPAWDGESTMGPFPTDHIFFRRGSAESVPAGMHLELATESYHTIERKFSSDHLGRFVWVRFAQAPTGG
jgi:endonuclease/exonuclease/phosphatase family metal-dependent hydrolase